MTSSAERSPRTIPEPIVCLALIATGAALRLGLQELPNFAPVAGLALFAGYYFRDRKWAIATPLGVMAVSDIFIGGYNLVLMITVYSMLTAPVLLRQPLRKWLQLHSPRASRVVLSILGLVTVGSLGSVAFFLVTNFAVWLMWYEYTLADLTHCYAMAVPFFRYTLIGDVTFSLGLFASYALAIRYLGFATPQPSAWKSETCRR